MADANYKGYDIIARPRQLAEDLRWTTNINIARWVNGEYRSDNFFANDTFETRDEATAACIQFGRRIIDGEVPGCSPP